MLEPEQEDLLAQLVEADRRVPRAERQNFFILNTSNPSGPPGLRLLHPGWPSDTRIPRSDIETLARNGYLQFSHGPRGADSFFITPEGSSYYRSYRMKVDEPLTRIVEPIRKHLDSAEFQKRYPKSYEKWARAEVLLWEEDTDSTRTTIGHLVREALQEFAGELGGHVSPPDFPTDKAKTIARLKSIIQMASKQLGESHRSFLETLIQYWGTLNDLVQRQEHGGQRENSSLTWEDSRRIALHSAILMFEVDSAIRRRS